MNGVSLFFVSWHILLNLFLVDQFYLSDRSILESVPSHKDKKNSNLDNPINCFNCTFTVLVF